MAMMNIPPSNPVLRIQMEKAMEEESESIFSCHDYENCKVAIQRNLERNVVQFSFSCHNFEEVFKSGEKFFLEKYYNKFTVAQTPNQGYDITLEMDLSPIKELKKIPKNLSPEEEEKLKEERNKQKQINKDFIKGTSQAISSFKRNFYASPIERILDNMVKDKQGQNNKTSYTTRAGERIWVNAENNDQVTVYFGFQFQDKVDRTIAQMVMDEMTESVRLINHPPSVKKGKYPDAVITSFPDVKNLKLKFDFGVMTLTLFKKQHFSDGVENASTFLQGLRQYLHYHVHASKSYLHSRLLNRINFFYKELQRTKFEKDEDKYYRTLKEDNLRVPGEVKEEDRLKANILKKQ